MNTHLSTAHQDDIPPKPKRGRPRKTPLSDKSCMNKSSNHAENKIYEDDPNKVHTQDMKRLSTPLCIEIHRARKRCSIDNSQVGSSKHSFEEALNFLGEAISDDFHEITQIEHQIDALFAHLVACTESLVGRKSCVSLECNQKSTPSALGEEISEGVYTFPGLDASREKGSDSNSLSPTEPNSQNAMLEFCSHIEADIESLIDQKLAIVSRLKSLSTTVLSGLYEAKNCQK